MIKKYVVFAVFHFLAVMPWSFLNKLAGLATVLLCFFKSSPVKTTDVNIRLCYPDMPASEQDQLVRRSIHNMVLKTLEMPGIWLGDPDRCLKNIENVYGRDVVEQARKDGKGIIFVAPHLGNWEELGVYLGKEFQPTILYRKPKQDFMDELLLSGRKKTGSHVVPTSKQGVSAVLKTLRGGGSTGILPDQVPEKGAGLEYSEFFGQQAPTMTLVSSLLRKGNIQAIGAAALHRPRGKFDIHFLKADEDIYSEDLETSVRGLNKTVEKLVELAPEQYQWEYKRFRRDKLGKRKIYR